MIIPTGLPAWLHANNHETYGGNVNKENYQGVDSINGRTDVSAQEYVRMAADVAAVQRTASFATLVYQCNDTIPDEPTVLHYNAMAGAAPTGARVSDGRVTWTWAASYLDEYGVEGIFHIVGATYAIEGTSNAAVNYQLLDPNTDGYKERIDARAFTTVALLDAVVCLEIFTGQV